MWYYLSFSLLDLTKFLGISNYECFRYFSPISDYVFKSSYKCSKFKEYILKEIYIRFGKYIIEHNYQLNIQSCFIIHTAKVVYDNYATYNKFQHMFNLNPKLLCLDVEDSSSEVQDASPVVVSAVD